MTALIAGRQTPERDGRLFSYPVAAGAKIYGGALVVLNATRFARGGVTATTVLAVGRAEHPADNTAGADGDLRIEVKAGCFYFANSAAGDLIARSDIGASCYVVDDQTVAKTDGGATRSKAGTILDIDPALGVLVGVGILHP